MTWLMGVHIGFGLVAIISGWLALAVRKGGTLHRRAGDVFVVSMLVMSAASVALAWLKPMMINVVVGTFCAYLVTSAWLTVRRKRPAPGAADGALLLLSLGVGVAGVAFGLQAMSSVDGRLDGIGADAYFFFGALGWIAAGLDAAMMLRGGVTGRHRLARHLWRMCLALFIATGSLFTGPGAEFFPLAVRSSSWMSLPEALVMLTMLFWLGKLLWQGWAAARQRRRGHQVRPADHPPM